MQSHVVTDVTQTLLSVLVIGALLAGSVWILLPFLSALIWAVMIVVATWPLLLRVQRLVGGRRSLAVAAMMLLIVLAFVIPFAVAIGTLVDAATKSPAMLTDFLAHGLAPPPDWVAKMPFGQPVADQWTSIAAGGPEALRVFVQPYARGAAGAALALTGGAGRAAVFALLTVLLVGMLYSSGETAARGVLAVAHRLGGDTGDRTVVLAGQAIRSVALGVVLTALTQSLLAGIGLWVCGIPHAGVLTAIAFVFGIAQLGPIFVLAPSILWLYWIGSTGWAVTLLAWSIPVVSLDNVLRPMLIRRGVSLPLLLIMAGVIGGLIAFGVIGLFLGPVILAVTYTLANEWVADTAVPRAHL